MHSLYKISRTACQRRLLQFELTLSETCFGRLFSVKFYQQFSFVVFSTLGNEGGENKMAGKPNLSVCSFCEYVCFGVIKWMDISI